MGTVSSDFKDRGSRISKNDCCLNPVCAHSHGLEMHVCGYIDRHTNIYTNILLWHILYIKLHAEMKIHDAPITNNKNVVVQY